MRLAYGLLTAQHHPSDSRPVADLYREAVDYVLVEDVLPLLRD